MRFLDSLRQLVRTYMARLAKKIDKLSGGIVSPDSITWAGVAGHLPIALFIAFGQLHTAAILMIIFGLFDVLDGEMARYKHIASPRGMVVDASTDRVKEVLVFSGIAYYLSQTAYFSWSFMPLLACGAIITVSYIKAKGEVAYAIRHKPDDHHKVNRKYSEGLVPFEIRTAIIILGLLIGHVLLACTIVALLGIYSIFERLSFITKRI